MRYHSINNNGRRAPRVRHETAIVEYVCVCVCVCACCVELLYVHNSVFCRVHGRGRTGDIPISKLGDTPAHDLDTCRYTYMK